MAKKTRKSPSSEGVLHLVLTYHWFDEMLSGRKDIEYRNMTQTWLKRIWMKQDVLKTVVFHRGYTAATITRPIEKITAGGCPVAVSNELGPGCYYRLHLGPIAKRNGC